MFMFGIQVASESEFSFAGFLQDFCVHFLSVCVTKGIKGAVLIKLARALEHLFLSLYSPTHLNTKC